MNICCKSMCFLMLPFRHKFRNAWHHLGKVHSHIVFATESAPFFVFMLNILQNDFSLRYVLTNGMSISRAFIAIRGYGTI
uniref:Uncharacterized protein n=1 Tax=Lepeophtheirus salmonis TaxID=72036 RepID=A0A0K2ULP0_LEPSM